MNPQLARKTGKQFPWKAIILICISLGFLWFSTSGLAFLKSNHVQKFDKILIREYDVERSYPAGSTTECTQQGLTRFGDITGIHVCSIITARIYYPRISVTQSKQTSLSSKQPSEENVSRIEYVNRQGKSLDEYIQFGIPTRRTGSIAANSIESKLGLDGFNHIIFSGLSGYKHDAVESGNIDGGWDWSSNPSWLGSNSPGSRLQTDITNRILANETPAKGAATINQALRQNTAPLVVFFQFRYCHSPSIPLLDKLCILPN